MPTKLISTLAILALAMTGVLGYMRSESGAQKEIKSVCNIWEVEPGSSSLPEGC